MALPKRKPPTVQTADPNMSWHDIEFMQEYPAMHAFLLDPTYEDGTSRLTGSMSFYTRLGVLHCVVNDNDRQLSAFVTAPTWAELLFLIDEGIAKDTLCWRSKQTSKPTQNPPF